MKKSIAVCIVIIFLLSSLFGCNKNVSTGESSTSDTQKIYESSYSTESAEPSTEEITTSKQPSMQPDTNSDELLKLKLTDVARIGAKDAEKLGVSKVITWISAMPVPESNVHAFNELLVKKYGCDFVVQFIYRLETSSYGEFISEAKELGIQVDILNSGGNNYYSSFVDNGYYISLNDYITNTENGRKLYDAYSEEVWDMVKRDGNIYGYVSRGEAGGRTVLLCNKDIAKKYNLNVADRFSFYELGEILNKASISSDDKVIPIYIEDSILELLGFENIYDAGWSIDFSGIFVKRDSDGRYKAINICEDEEFLKLCRTIREYKVKGYIRDINDSATGTAYRNGDYIFCITTVYGAELVKDKVFFNAGNVISTVSVGDIFYKHKIKYENMVNGVASWSENVDEALKVITLINTETDLSTVMYMGIEGTDYKYDENGVPVYPKTNKMIHMSNISNMANVNILPQTAIESVSRLEYNKELSSHCKDSPALMYGIDISMYKNDILEISKIFGKYYKGLLNGKYEDVDGIIGQMNEEFKKAGINEIVSAINSQIER